jgi:hypothetical protein
MGAHGLFSAVSVSTLDAVDDGAVLRMGLSRVGAYLCSAKPEKPQERLQVFA